MERIVLEMESVNPRGRVPPTHFHYEGVRLRMQSYFHTLRFSELILMFLLSWHVLGWEGKVA